jgi:hypothetical protein
MKTIIIVFVLLGGIILSDFQPKENPRAEISNGIIKARLYLPDTKNGYYMATRFDWSGVISSLEYKGHNYFGQWFEKYSPTIHDAIMGPVEEFSPLNYEEAELWDNFIKIGVGVLTKPADKKYSSFTLYPIVDPGYWKIEKEADEVKFMQELNHENYSYEYTKSVQLVEGKPEMVISHILKNTGNLTIETDVYNHNFFVIDNQPTGTGLALTFPVDISGTGRGIGDIAELQGKKVIFKRDLVKGESIFCRSLEGLNDSLVDYDIKIDNLISGAGARIRSDQSLSKMVLWGCSTTLCPEPYIHIKVEPGKEFKWSYFYEFYISEVPKQ